MSIVPTNLNADISIRSRGLSVAVGCLGVSGRLAVEAGIREDASGGHLASSELITYVFCAGLDFFKTFSSII